MTATTILAVRHGETVWNLQGRMQGYLDSDLDAGGVQQADLLGLRLAGETIDAVYSSDLGRTLATARGITRHTRHEIRQEPGLRERHLGKFQGLTGEEAAKHHPDDWRRFKSRDPHHDLGDGETLVVFSARCVTAVERIAAAHPGGRVLVVSHGGVLDCLYRHALGISLDAPRNWTLLNASLNTLTVSAGDWRLVHWGDVDHLGVRDAIDDI